MYLNHIKWAKHLQKIDPSFSIFGLLISQSSWYIQRIRFGFRFGSVENFKEVGGFCSHSRMNVGFGAFDVIMKVVSK